MSKAVNRWSLVVAAGLAILMAQLDTTIVTVALPVIADDLGVAPGTAQWVVLGYVVPVVALSLLAGRWIDRIGVRTATLAAVAVLGVASGAAAISPGATSLIAARVVQGTAAALLLAASPALAVTAVEPSKRGRALAVVGTLGPVGAMSGPAIGGLLVDRWGWPTIFLLNLPIVIAVVALVAPRGAGRARLAAPDRAWLVEAALLGSAAVGVLLALTPRSGGVGFARLWLLAPSALLVVAWWRTETSSSLRRLLASPPIRAAHLAFVGVYTAVLSILFLTPFFLLSQGVSVAAIGAAMVAFPAAAALMGPVAGWASDRWSPRPVAIGGGVATVAALMLLAPLDSAWDVGQVGWRIGLVGIGVGLFITANQTLVLTDVPDDSVGFVSGSANLARFVGIALGPAAATATWALSGYTPAGMTRGIWIAAAAVTVGITVLATAQRPHPSPTDPSHQTRRPDDRPLPRRKADIMTQAHSPRVAVIYYSATGNVYELAGAVAEGAEEAGAEVRLRQVPELAPEEAIDSNPAWRTHHDATRDIPEATLEDLEWADAYAFGTPTRFGNVASQLKQFLDTTSSLWAQGILADKAVTGFTSAINRHGGNETTLLALYNTAYHWGSVIVPPGYTDPSISGAGGNPYGVSHASMSGNPPEETLAAARYQGQRLTNVASVLVGLRRRRRVA